MIIGNGLLAKSLTHCDRENVLFIAAGVSDSKCNDPKAFDREKKLVIEQVKSHPDKVIVFFSSYSVKDPVMANNEYVKVKLWLEDYVLKHASKCLIIRISNLVGQGGNPKNVFNFFFQQIATGNRFSLWANSRRNIIMVDDLVKILNYILEYELEEKINSVLNIINITTFSTYEIVAAIEGFTGRKAVYDTVNIESLPAEVDEHSKKMFELLNIDTDNYLQRILKLYYAGHAAAITG